VVLIARASDGLQMSFYCLSILAFNYPETLWTPTINIPKASMGPFFPLYLGDTQDFFFGFRV